MAAPRPPGRAGAGKVSQPRRTAGQRCFEHRGEPGQGSVQHVTPDPVVAPLLWACNTHRGASGVTQWTVHIGGSNKQDAAQPWHRQTNRCSTRVRPRRDGRTYPAASTGRLRARRAARPCRHDSWPDPPSPITTVRTPASTAAATENSDAVCGRHRGCAARRNADAARNAWADSTYAVVPSTSTHPATGATERIDGRHVRTWRHQ